MKIIIAGLGLILGFLGSDWFSHRALEKQRLTYEDKIEKYEANLSQGRELKNLVEQGFTTLSKEAADARAEAKYESDLRFGSIDKSIGGLRSTIQGIEPGIAKANRDAVNQYAVTTGRLFSACVQEYVWMGKRANEHRIDLIEHRDAWPRYVQPDKPVQGE